MAPRSQHAVSSAHLSRSVKGGIGAETLAGLLDGHVTFFGHEVPDDIGS